MESGLFPFDPGKGAVLVKKRGISDRDAGDSPRTRDNEQGKTKVRASSKKGDKKMRKTGFLILLLVPLVAASCSKEENAPAPATQEVAAGASDATAPARVTEGSENSRAGTTEAGKPRIAFHQKDFDFGKVEMGEKVEHIYRFRNSGTGTLVISKVGSS